MAIAATELPDRRVLRDPARRFASAFERKEPSGRVPDRGLSKGGWRNLQTPPRWSVRHFSKIVQAMSSVS